MAPFTPRKKKIKHRYKAKNANRKLFVTPKAQFIKTKHYATKLNKLNRRNKRKGRKSLNRKSLLNILTVPNVWTKQLAEAYVLAASTTAGKNCAYFTQDVGDPYVSRDPVIMSQIAFLIDTSTNPQIKFTQTSFKMEHQLTNLSNVEMLITTYLCEARRDITNTFPQADVLDTLQQGFTLSGSQLSITDAANSPFDSSTFVQLWNIKSVKKRNLLPGHTTSYAVRDNAAHSIRPSSDMDMPAGATYATGDELYHYKRGCKFILFKMELAKMGINSDGGLTAANATRVQLLSKVHYIYKHIEDHEPTTTISPSTGYGAPSGNVDIPIQQVVQTTASTSVIMNAI